MQILTTPSTLGVLAILCAPAVAQLPQDGVAPHQRAAANTVAATAASVQSVTQKAWQEFQARHGADWKTHWNLATDTPEHIWGPGLRLADSGIPDQRGARRHANQVLARFSTLLGATNSVLTEDTYAKVRQIHMFGYRQSYRGLPVIGGRATVMINDVGVLALFGSHALQIPKGFSTLPRLQLGLAYAKGHDHAGVEPQQNFVEQGPRGRLVIWGDPWLGQPTPIRLAWEVKIDRPDLEKVGRVYVDAMNGRVLRFENDVHNSDLGHATARPVPANTGSSAGPRVEVSYGAPLPKVNVTGTIRAWTNTSNTPSAGLVNVPMRNMRVQILGGSAGFTDAAGRFNIPHGGTAVVNVRIAFTGSRVAALTPAQGTTFTRTVAVQPGTPANIQIYTSTAAQFDRAQSTAYWATNDVNEFIRGRGLQDARLDGMRITVNQASACNAFYSNFSMTFFHAAGGCVNTAYRSVVYHEFGHGVDHAYGGINRNEGMSEGSADILAMIVADDPIVGRDFRGVGNHIRDARNTLTFPAGGGVHQQGMTWMGWFWDVRNNLAAKLGTTQARELFRQFGIGIFPANPGSQAAGVRVVFTLDDNDGNLNNGTPNCAQLAAACTKRNLPNPATCVTTVPGRYTLFGRSCPGSRTVAGISFCHLANTSCATPFSSGNSNVFAIRCVAGSAGATIGGFYLRTQSINSATNTIRTFLHTADAAGRPSVAAARASSMRVGPTYGWYYTAFSTPLVLGPNRVYYIAFSNQGMRHPICGSGGTKKVHYWHPPSATAWNGPFTTQPWSFIVRCTTTRRLNPFLSATGVPRINSSFQVNLRNALGNATAILYTGSSRTRWFSFVLPFNLAPYGAPDCFINSSWESAVVVRTSAAGTASTPVAFPNDPSMIGTVFYNQWRVLDSAANAFGSATSNSGEGRVGS